MNRPIKFRAFINSKLYIQEYCGGFCYFIHNESDALSMEDVFVLAEQGKCVVQQFTGLTDSAGKEIYEGDVLKWDTGENFSEVVFLHGSFFVRGINWGAFWYLSDYKTNYEILGNIFESPELLKIA